MMDGREGIGLRQRAPVGRKNKDAARKPLARQ